MNNLAAVTNNRTIKRVIINTIDKVHVLNTDDIAYIRAKASYSVFILVDGIEILSSQPIALYNKLLQDANFFRVHKSFLVNVDLIQEIVKSGDVIITGGAEIPIAKENIKPLIEMLSALQ
jgi:two-component system LytT family response regulator